MSKSANPGELRTSVYFIRVDRKTDDEAVPQETEVNVFGDTGAGRGVPIKVKWVNAHGTEIFTAMQLQLKSPATITMRYSPKINEQLIVYKGNDPQPYEIISIDNVDERNRWLEIKVQRKVSAR